MMPKYPYRGFSTKEENKTKTALHYEIADEIIEALIKAGVGADEWKILAEIISSRVISKVKHEWSK